ncbi:unnamed protein product [Trichobilharzia regenti]|nr:unnamed protein product [Trichobilharzia regenti]
MRLETIYLTTVSSDPPVTTSAHYLTPNCLTIASIPVYRDLSLGKTITGNKIRNLDGNSFRGLIHLKTLLTREKEDLPDLVIAKCNKKILSNNGIENIESDAFNQLINLRRL